MLVNYSKQILLVLKALTQFEYKKNNGNLPLTEKTASLCSLGVHLYIGVSDDIIGGQKQNKRSSEHFIKGNLLSLIRN